MGRVDGSIAVCHLTRNPKKEVKRGAVGKHVKSSTPALRVRSTWGVGRRDENRGQRRKEKN